MLNDIKKGGNQGCGTPGFTAVEGTSCRFFAKFDFVFLLFCVIVVFFP